MISCTSEFRTCARLAGYNSNDCNADSCSYLPHSRVIPSYSRITFAHMHARCLIVAKAGQSADMLWLMLWRVARKVFVSVELISGAAHACASVYVFGESFALIFCVGRHLPSVWHSFHLILVYITMCFDR